MGMFLLMLIDGHYLTCVSPNWPKLGENSNILLLKLYAQYEASNVNIVPVSRLPIRVC